MILNEYRLLADFLHGSAILLLIFYMIKTRSCHSVSGLSIILYIITFYGSYLDVSSPSFFSSTYGTFYTIYYLSSSYLLLFLIYGVFYKTRDQVHQTFPIFGYLIGAHLLTWGTCYLTEHNSIDQEYFRRFSIYLEIFVIIPQLILIYKQGILEKAMACYLLMLGSYRGLYILNWIEGYNTESHWDPISFYCGCAQTIIYLYFFIHIYPQVNQCHLVEKEVVKVVEAKENIQEKTVPLIHTVV